MITTGANLPAITEQDIALAIDQLRAKTGRPTKFNPTIAAEILERLKCGETMVSICSDERMPSRPTVWDWGKHNAAFANNIAEARAAWTHATVEHGLQQLLDAPTDAMTHVKKADSIARHTLEIAARLNPNDYADKKQVQMDVRQVTIRTSSDVLRRYVDEE